MSEYSEFTELADGTVFPDRITNTARLEVPARSFGSPANLYVRVTGIANFDVDPAVRDAAWHRGMLGVVLPVLRIEDTLLEASVNAFIRVLIREEEGPSDDFAIALDDVSSVRAKPSGELVITVNTAYMGDVWIKRMGFAANLLVHRPSLDHITPNRPLKFTLEDLLNGSTTLELHFPKRG